MMAQMCSMKRSSARRMKRQCSLTLVPKVSSFLRYVKDSISDPVHAVPQDVLPFPKQNMSALSRPSLAESSTTQTSMPAC